MKRSLKTSNHHLKNRVPRGFTMIELLVVIGIILFLVGMTVAVVGGVLTTARTKATKATIEKIDGMLIQRMEAFTMAMKSQKLDGTNSPVVLKRKQLFRAGFPQNLKEAFNITDTATDSTASSEALYELLVNKPSYGAAAESDAFNSNEVKDTDGDGRLEFVDGWGQPLRFYRWPTRLIRPAPQGDQDMPQTIETTSGPSPQEYYKFPLWPNFGNGFGAELLLGQLQTQTSGASRKTTANPNPTLGDELSDPLAKDPDDALGLAIGHTPTKVTRFENAFHTPDTWSTPLIISAGPDGVLGLYEPADITNHGYLAQPKMDPDSLNSLLDSITNRNSK